MGFFFSDPANRIPFRELDKHLTEMKFSKNQRDTIKKQFEEHKSSGISEKAIKKVVSGFKKDFKDGFSSFQADRLQDGLLNKIQERISKPKPEIKEPPKIQEFKNPEIPKPNSEIGREIGRETGRLDKAA